MGCNRLLIFDLDGTLLDTSEGILSSIKFVLSKNGFNSDNMVALKSLIGPPVETIFNTIDNDNAWQTKKMAAEFRDHYAKVDLFKAQKYPGIDELISFFKEQGYVLAIATNKQDSYTKVLLKHFGLDKAFDYIQGSTGDCNNKEKIITKCIKSTNISDLNDVIVIGDSNSDEIAAHACNVRFVAVGYGFGFSSEAQVVNHDGYAQNVTELITVLHQLP